MEKNRLNKSRSIISRKKIHIEWGDCDPAQIVYFPRYLEYFDACTTALFKKADLPKKDMIKKYRIIGIPVVDLRVSFIAPSRFGDEVVVESEVIEWRRSSFCIRHRLFNVNVLSVECFETRVWCGKSPKKPEKIESKPLPPEVVAKFRSGRGEKV